MKKYSNTQVSKPYQRVTILNFMQFPITSLPRGVQVGCKFLTMKEWQEQLEEIAKKEGVDVETAYVLYNLVKQVRDVQRYMSLKDRKKV